MSLVSHSEPRLKGFLAAADLRLKQYHFVKLSTDGQHVTYAGANERAIGILMNAPNTGEPAEVALQGGGALLSIAEAVTIGKLLTPEAAGQGEVADAAGEWVGAIAMDGGAEDDVISVEVIQCQAQASDA
jgi:hypothetical protein